MPFCPICRSEYRVGFTSCASCPGVTLVDELPQVEELREADPEKTRPVGFATTSDISRVVEVEGGRSIDLLRVFLLHQASELERALMAAGIPAAIVPVDAPFLDDHQRFEVRVRNEDHQRAEDLLRANFADAVLAEGGNESGGTDIEHCPACGAHVPLEVEECPECGLNVGGG